MKFRQGPLPGQFLSELAEHAVRFVERDEHLLNARLRQIQRVNPAGSALSAPDFAGVSNR